MLDLDQVLADAVRRGASDVHIKVGSPPFMRIDGELVHASDEIVQPADTERIAFAIMPKVRAEEFIATNEADFAYSLNGVGRFRVNVFRQRGLGRPGAAAHPPGDPADRGARAPAGRAVASPRSTAGSCSSPARPVRARRRRSPR